MTATRRLDELAAELIIEIARNLWLGDMSQLAQANRRLYQIIDAFLYQTDAQPYCQYALFWAARHNLPTVAERALRAGTHAVSRYSEPAALRPFGQIMFDMDGVKSDSSPELFSRYRAPLDIAASKGHIKVVAALLRHPQPIEHLDVQTAIAQAAANGHVETMSLILRYAKHARERVAQAVEIAFCAAAKADQRAVLERLFDIREGPASVDTFAQYYRIAMMGAAGAGHDEVWDLLSSIQPLAELDADPATQYAQLARCFGMSVTGKGSRGIIELFNRFISLGFDLTREPILSSLVDQACARDNVALLEVLLTYSRNEQRDREVIFRHHYRSPQVSKMLLARGISRDTCEEVFQLSVLSQCIGGAWMTFSAMHNATGRMTDDAGHMLHVACHEASPEIVQLLLSVGSPQERRDKAEWQEQGQRNGQRPLQALMYDGKENERFSIATMLLEAGADPNNKCADVGRKRDDSPLYRACLWGLPMVAQLLLEYGADPKYWGDGRSSVLHTACLKCPDVALIQDLLERGADPTARTFGGATPLHEVCLARRASTRGSPMARYQIAKLLIAYGADPNAENVTGATPLHYASFTTATDPEDAKVALALLEHGADIEKRSKNGYGPPLYLACSTGNLCVASVLLAHGAHLSPQTLSGFSGEHCSWIYDRFGDRYMHESIKLLLAYGADKGMLQQAILVPLSRKLWTFYSLRLLLMRGVVPDHETTIVMSKNCDGLRTEALAKALGMISIEPVGSFDFNPASSVALSWPDEKMQSACWMEAEEEEDVLYY